MTRRTSLAITGVIALAIFGVTLWGAVITANYISDGGLAHDLGQNVKEFEKARN